MKFDEGRVFGDLTPNLEIVSIDPQPKKNRSKNHISGYNTKQLKNKKFKPISKLKLKKKI